MFTKKDLENIANLIQRAKITGQEAITVALLLQKISQHLSTEENPKTLEDVSVKGEKEKKK